jgi:oligopeptidase A
MKFNIEQSYSTLLEDLKIRLSDNIKKINILSRIDSPTWDNFVMPIETLNDKLSQWWAPIQHLHSVKSTPQLREVYDAFLPLLSDYYTTLLQNEDLYRAYQVIKNQSLNAEQKTVIENTLRDFKLSGINLNAAEKETFKQLNEKLSLLCSHFEANVLDSENDWSFNTQETPAGIPALRLSLAKEKAEHKNLSGYLFTLQADDYHDIMTYANSRELRQTFYEAYTTRASELFPSNKNVDNSENIKKILACCHEQAKLLGFKSYAELSLATKMAESPDDVLTFLNELVDKLKPKAKQELDELTQFSGLIKLEPWDTTYYSEQLMKQRYHVDQEILRSYFLAEKARNVLFMILNKLYGIHFQQREIDTWHPDVIFYDVLHENHKIIAGIYMDLFSRENKRSGAWMDDPITRRRLDAYHIQLPVAFLTCNFAPLLTHDDLITLFHEMGHCLQHVLTQMEYVEISGIHGVPWDAVEFPSQFLEGWCWNKDVLKLFNVPEKMIDDLIASKNFNAALHLIRQLEFSIFDMRLFTEYDPIQKNYIEMILSDVRSKVSVIRASEKNRSAHSFTHIFSGGYSAGYYSYLWAEVLARDAFMAFEETDIFSPTLGQRFKDMVLAKGGSENPLILFEQFRGRAPDPDALLRYYGLTE